MTDNSTNKNRDADSSRSESSREELRNNQGYEKASSDRSSSSDLDEKSSTMGRRNKNSGLATKDGVTGSDYDGQVSE